MAQPPQGCSPPAPCKPLHRLCTTTQLIHLGPRGSVGPCAAKSFCSGSNTGISFFLVFLVLIGGDNAKWPCERAMLEGISSPLRFWTNLSSEGRWIGRRRSAPYTEYDSLVRNWSWRVPKIKNLFIMPLILPFLQMLREI